MDTEKINSVASLKKRILSLQQLQKKQEQELRLEFKSMQERLQPANLVKSAAKDLFRSANLKERALELGLAVVSGSVSKKIAFDLLKQPLKKALASGLKLLDKNNSREPGSVKSRILNTLTTFFDNHEKPA